MKIDFRKDGDSLFVSLEGRLDTVTAPQLEAFLEQNPASALTLDCEKLAYVSSAGLRVLLVAQKKLKDALKLIHVQEMVMEVFEVTGFADILVIE